MLILILIDAQYSQKAVFSFEKESICQKSLHLRLPSPGKKIHPVQFLIPSPLTTIWKTLKVVPLEQL